MLIIKSKLVANFDITNRTKGQKLYQWIKGKTLDNASFNNFQKNPFADELSQTLTYLKRENITDTDIVSFGGRIGNSTKYTDTTRANPPLLYVELKSLKEGSDGLDDLGQTIAGNVMSGLHNTPLRSRPQFVNQFIDGYLSNINSLDELEYVFEARKLGANGETFIKEQFKDLFIAKARDMFIANENLIKQLDRIGGGKIRNLNDFENLLNHSSFSLNNPIFNFIKIQ